MPGSLLSNNYTGIWGLARFTQATATSNKLSINIMLVLVVLVCENMLCMYVYLYVSVGVCCGAFAKMANGSGYSIESSPVVGSTCFRSLCSFHTYICIYCRIYYIYVPSLLVPLNAVNICLYMVHTHIYVMSIYIYI